MVLPAQPATEVAPSTLPERIARLIAPFDLAPRPLSVAEALERSAALLQVAAVAWNAPLGGVPAPDVERALARLASVFVDGDPEPWAVFEAMVVERQRSFADDARRVARLDVRRGRARLHLTVTMASAPAPPACTCEHDDGDLRSRVVEALQRTPDLSLPSEGLQLLCDADAASLRSVLRDLELEGLVRRTGRGRGTRYRWAGEGA